jgi:predicted dehydrogenase
MANHQNNQKIDRRSFLRSTAVTGAGLAVSPLVFGQTSGTASQVEDINVALLGAGAQGQVLMNACLKIPGIRFKAVCDIWTNYNLLRASRTLELLKHPNKRYQDYQEMLDKEKDLDAVIIATPDFWHSRQTTACLEAGLHVYCEKAMSNTIEGAKTMAAAAKKTGKLLQIGHQRRSNPSYIHCYEKIIKETNLLSQITSVYGQWNRSRIASEFIPPINNAEIDIDTATLRKYEYDSMEQFRNWQWFKNTSGGPVVNLGIHQIDIFNWFLGTNPKSVIASGGVDYWKDRQWYDNVIAVYEYQTPGGIVRALYRTSSTNDSLKYFEQFMGTDGTLLISENASRNRIYRQEGAELKKWQPWIDKGYLQFAILPATRNDYQVKKEDGRIVSVIDISQSDDVPNEFVFPMTNSDKPAHQPHLENFFDAIRGKAKLNCPADVAYKTTVSVLKINEAVAAGRKLEFQPQDFEV